MWCTLCNYFRGIAKETYESIKKLITTNKSVENSESVLPFLKIAVEKYVFDKTE